MNIGEIIINFFDIITSTGTNKLDKFIELENIKIENHQERKQTKKLAIKDTVICIEKKANPSDMNVYYYEYSKNWWRRKHGHYNEELYRKFLNTRAPELH